MRCADCKHFITRKELGDPGYVAYVAAKPPFGRCMAWYAGYDEPEGGQLLNGVTVENDEGWGNVVGPEFGCVLFEAKP